MAIERTDEGWQAELKWALENNQPEYANEVRQMLGVTAGPEQPPPAPEPTGDYMPRSIAGEFAGAANNAVMDTLDFLVPGSINAASRLMGFGSPLPTFSEGFSNLPGANEQFMPSGTARDVVRAAGSTLPAAGSLMPSVGRNLASTRGVLAEIGGFGSASPGATQVARAATDQALNPKVAAMAERADEIGWPITPGDRSGSVTLKKLESAIDSFPMVSNPMHRIATKRQGILNRNAAESMGLRGDTALTSDVMGSTAEDISGTFKSLEGLDPLSVSDEFVDSLVGTQTAAKTRLFSDPQIEKTINRVFDMVDEQGVLKAEDYQSLTSQLKSKIRQAWKGDSPDPDFAQSLGEIVDALDQLALNDMNPAALSKLRDARSRWKALTTLEKSRSVRESGDVSGPLLANYLRRTDKGGYGRGGNVSDLYESARMSKAFPNAPDSGTAGRMLFQNMIANPVGTALGALASPLTTTAANTYMHGGGALQRTGRALSPKAGQLGSYFGRGFGALLEEEE